VEEESKRDTSVIIEREGQSLRTMPSGERQVALLKHLISLQPKSMVVENFYENLDPINRKNLESLLFDYSKSNSVIQVVSREKKLFPFISDLYTIEKKELVPFYESVSFF
jgi:ABC-type phosphate transport system ATPase subunit